MKVARNMALILIAGIVLGFLLLAATYALPFRNLEAHVAESVSAFEGQNSHHYVGAYANSGLDNYTDALMLEMASYNGEESVIDKAAYSFYKKYKGITPNESIIMHYGDQGTMQEPQAQAYSQYWHGYVNTLRPLLSMMNYQQIRVLNTIVLAALFLLVLLLMLHRMPAGVLPFIVCSLFLMPHIVVQSLQYSSMSYVTLFILAAMLLLAGKKRSIACWCYLFLISGMCTAYLDLLTFPTVTLTLPLFVLCGLTFDDLLSLKDRFLFILRCCISWGMGYAGMWAAKWFIVLLVAGKDFLPYLFDQMQTRISTTENTWFIRIKVIIENIAKLLCDFRLDLVFALVFGISLTCCIRNGSFKRPLWNTLLPYGFIALIPFGWTVIMSNHSDYHSFFTFRIYAPLIFAVLFLLNKLAVQAKTKA